MNEQQFSFRSFGQEGGMPDGKEGVFRKINRNEDFVGFEFDHKGGFDGLFNNFASMKVVKKPLKIAVMTSGGDAPGLNACIRAIVITAERENMEVVGVMHGYDGLINGEFIPLGDVIVKKHMERGGTFLKSSRSEGFMKAAGRRKALNSLKERNVSGLLVIGGNGSMKGLSVFASETGFPVIGIPKTIDNDVNGTDFAIGFDTAVNSAIEAIDRIRDSADSHERVFFIEVMGRNAGHLALQAGIATGADHILIPERKTELSVLEKKIHRFNEEGHEAMIVLVAEGDDAGKAQMIQKKMQAQMKNVNMGFSVLGYIQRGGTPSAYDRVLAARFGEAAAFAMKHKKKGVMVAIVNGKIAFVPLRDVVKKPKTIDADLLRLARILNAVS